MITARSAAINIYTLPPKLIRFLIGLWPPFWFTGIRFAHISHDFREVKVDMALRFYNKNAIGIQYGGNLFSMTDPCYMLMLMRNLGRDYKIIDQSASIEFVNPGLGPVHAICHLTQKDIDEISGATESGEKYLKTFHIDIVDQEQNVIAKVCRVVYIRKKLS